MEPPYPFGLINEGSFTTANPSLAEIWPFNNNNGGGMLGLQRMGSLIEGSESTVTHQTGTTLDTNLLSTTPTTTTTSCNDDSDDLGKGSHGKRIKPSASQDDNRTSKPTEATSASDNLPEPLKDYIHVRARRGQATDSHSLAERARREKISERMKILQDLVPGCNKVIGKALVLDEIINYIQSLQRQVEFLSMKLEAVNSGMPPSINGFHSKDSNQLGVTSFDASGMMFSAQAATEFVAAAAGGPQSEWLHMQLGGSFERTT